MAEAGGRKWTLVNEGAVEEFAVRHLADRMGLPRIEPDGSGVWRTVPYSAWTYSGDMVGIPAPEVDADALGTAVAGGRWLAGRLLKEIRKDIGAGTHSWHEWGCVREGEPVVDFTDWGERREYVRHLRGLKAGEKALAAEEIAKGREAYVFGYELDGDGYVDWAYGMEQNSYRRIDHNLGPDIEHVEGYSYNGRSISDGIARRIVEAGGEPPRPVGENQEYDPWNLWENVVRMVAAELPPRAGETPEARAARLSALGLSGRKPKESLSEELKSTKSTLADIAVKAAGWRDRETVEKGLAQSLPVGEPIPDGRRWFRLTGPEALDYESGRMAHCVGHGNFDDEVSDGRVRIYSLRREREGATPKPSLTVRVTFLDEGTRSVSGSNLGRVDVVQVEEIKGFANALPKLPGKAGDGQGKEEPELDKEALAAVAELVNSEFPGKQVRWREPKIGESGTEYVLEGGRWTLFRGLDDPSAAEIGRHRFEAGVVAKGGRVWMPKETVAVGMRVEGASVSSLPERIVVEGPLGNLASGKFGHTDAAFVGCTLDGREPGTFLVGRRKDGSVHVVDVASPEARDAYTGVLCWFDSDDGLSGLKHMPSSSGTKVVLKAPEVWLPMLRTAGEVKVEGRLMSLPDAIACGTLDLSDAAGPDGKPYPLHELLHRKNFHVDFIRWGDGPGQEVCMLNLQLWSQGLVSVSDDFKQGMEFVSAMSVRDPKLAALVGRGLEEAMVEGRLQFTPSATDARAMVRFCRIAAVLRETAPRIAGRLAAAARKALEAMPVKEREEWADRNPCSAKVVASLGRPTPVKRAVETETVSVARTGDSKGWAAAGAKASKSVGKGLGGGGIGL